MDTDKLINDLSRDLKPVKPLKPLWLRAVLLTAIGTALMLVALAVAGGPRDDLQTVADNPLYLTEAFAIFFAGILAAIAACGLAVPDSRVRFPVRVPLALAHAVWLALIALTVHTLGADGLAHISHGGPCTADLALMLLAPLAAGVLYIMQGAPVWRGLAGYTLTLSMASFGAAAMRLLCANDAAGHLLFWHFLPVLVFAVAGIYIGRFAMQFKK